MAKQDMRRPERTEEKPRKEHDAVPEIRSEAKNCASKTNCRNED